MSKEFVGQYHIRYWVEENEKLCEEIERMREDTLKVVSEWFDAFGGDENEWRKLEQALGLPLTPLPSEYHQSWEEEEKGEEE